MKRLAFYLAVAIVIPGFASLGGCLQCPIEGWVTSWQQAEVFEKMPANESMSGPESDYRLNESEGNLGRNRGAATTRDGYRVSLLAYERGTVMFSVGITPGHSSRPSESTMRDWLSDVFVDLSLGSPDVTDFDMDASSSGC